LRKIFDALADTSLKCFLERKTDAGNANHRASLVQGIGDRRVKFGAKADKAGSIRRGQLEHARKPGGRREQVNAVRGLAVYRVTLRQKS
jgi:hypothetical protein